MVWGSGLSTRGLHNDNVLPMLKGLAMDDANLSDRHCKACEGGQPPLGGAEVQKLLAQLPRWTHEGKQIVREFEFKNFIQAMAFLNKVATIAESEGHHPDFTLYSYKKVRVVLWTHSVQGLTENDFIVAAKIDEVTI